MQVLLAEILRIRTKTLNNKINGYSDFSYSEVMIICDKYNSSSDIL